MISNILLQKKPLLAAHRGVCGANIPCNTLAAYAIALQQGADIIELDVSKSLDGELFAFHPGMEPVYLKCGKMISEMTAKEVREVPLLNQDEVPTHYRVPTLEEALAFLKDKAYINVDKFWTDVEGITACIRRAGVERQAIVKTYLEEDALREVEKFAPDLMFMPMVRHKDESTEMLLKRNINLIGNEVLFDWETDEVISDAYIAEMHRKGLLIWANAIVYNEQDVISAGHTDDVSLTEDPDLGWGWLIRKKVDIIQTDWPLMLKQYIDSRKQRNG